MATVATRGDSLRLEISDVEIRHLRLVGTLAGVAPLAAAGRNGPGIGRLRACGEGDVLAWLAPGSSTYGAQVDVSAGGDFLLEDGDDADKWLRVSVTAARLGTGPGETQVHLGDVYGNGVSHDDVSAAEALAGSVEIYQITLANDGPMDLLDLRCWIDAAVSGIEVSLNGADWFTPDAEDHGDVLIWARLAAEDTTTLHVRRTIGAAAEADAGVLTLLHFGWDGF